MKLIYCRDCQDVVALSQKTRRCDCERSGGRYNDDGDTILIYGPCVVYGLDNRVLMFGRGEGFVYPEGNGKVYRTERGDLRFTRRARIVVPVGFTESRKESE